VIAPGAAQAAPGILESAMKIRSQLSAVISGVLLCLGLSMQLVLAQSCDFAPVKSEIDQVIERDPVRAAKFRKEVAEGSDSIKVLTDLARKDLHAMIDICRFDVAEYLTKRGFPPAH